MPVGRGPEVAHIRDSRHQGVEPCGIRAHPRVLEAGDELPTVSRAMHALDVMESTPVRVHRQRHVARLCKDGADVREAGQTEVLPDGSLVHCIELRPVGRRKRSEREAV